MTSITGNASRDAQQRLDSVDHHLGQLRALVASGELVLDGHQHQGPDAHPASGRDFGSVMTETFGHWVLDFLGLGELDPTDAVREARTRLVGALSRNADPAGTPAGIPDNLFVDTFVDVFAGEDLASVADDELGVKPISYEA